jgi:hypothetical protein
MTAADWTTISGTIDYAPVLAFMVVAVTAGFSVRLALKGVSMAKSALSKS